MPFLIKSALLSVLLTLSRRSDITNIVVYRQNVTFDLIKKPGVYDSITYDYPNQFDIDKGRLSGQIRTLDVSFAAISCSCAQWFETKFEKKESRDYIFLEASNNKLKDAETLFDGNNLPVRILVTGQFYTKKGFPTNYRPAKGSPSAERVFRYTQLKIIKLGSNH